MEYKKKGKHFYKLLFDKIEQIILNMYPHSLKPILDLNGVLFWPRHWEALWLGGIFPRQWRRALSHCGRISGLGLF